MGRQGRAAASTNLPDGQNVPSAAGQITFTIHAILSPRKGRWPSSPNVGMGCGGRGGIVRAMGSQGGINSVSGRRTCRRAVLKRTAKSCGPDASEVGVKSFGGAKAQPGRSASFRKATEARKPDTPGRARYKP